MRKKWYLIVLVAIFAFYVAYALVEHVRLIRTSGILSKSWLAVSATLDEDKWNAGYSPAREGEKFFQRPPATIRLPIKDQHIIDGWGHPLEIDINADEEKFWITITSAGKDGILRTNDDLRRWGSKNRNGTKEW